MDVPIQARASTESGIDSWEEAGGDEGGDVAADEVVAEGCEEEFVDVEG